MRVNLLKEKHSGGIAGHFGNDKTYAQLNNFYYWPGMRTDVQRFVGKMSSLSACKGEAA